MKLDAESQGLRPRQYINIFTRRKPLTVFQKKKKKKRERDKICIFPIFNSFFLYRPTYIHTYVYGERGARGVAGATGKGREVAHGWVGVWRKRGVRDRHTDRQHLCV